MLTLYRKYRPAKFSEISGQEHIVRILTEELKQGRIAHAYLFSGPRGVGKTSTARIFAKAANCQDLDEKIGEPCGQCQSCRNLLSGTSSDLIEIDGASNNGVAEVRELRENVKYVPAASRYKIYVIDEVHMLSASAFNALLKTLEEPPGHVIFILATTELRKIPETIFSRCQHFAFRKLALEKTVARLRQLSQAEKVKVADEVLEEIARRSGGALRDAESMLGQILGLGKKEISPEDAALFLPKAGFAASSRWLSHLLERDGKQALIYLEKLDGDGVNFEFFLSEVSEMARQLLLFKITESHQYWREYFSPAETEVLEQMAAKTDASFLRKVLIELLRSSNDLRLSTDLPILPLELAAAALCVDNNPSPLPAGEAGVESEAQVNEGLSGARVKKNEDNIIKGQDKVEVERTTTAKDGGKNHSLEDILDGWGEVLSRARDSSHALNFMLGVARPLSISGDMMELGFKYRLQQEKISERANRQEVEKIVEEVYGRRFRVQPVLKENLPAAGDKTEKSEDTASDEEILIKTALQVFDGAVLEN